MWNWSGRRGSNPRPTAWKAVTLPLSYSRPRLVKLENRNCRNWQVRSPNFQFRISSFLSPTGGQGRIRTPVARKERQVYSLLPLTTRPPVHFSPFRSLATAIARLCRTPNRMRLSWKIRGQAVRREDRLAPRSVSTRDL